jgi:hypothetical protein
MVHGSRQRVNNVLAGLEALGCIQRDGPTILITDVALLRRRSQI